jgi:hypothetical protein
MTKLHDHFIREFAVDAYVIVGDALGTIGSSQTVDRGL